jgi:tRNA(Ile)-lysidine synthase
MTLPGIKPGLCVPGSLQLGSGWMLRTAEISSSVELLSQIQANTDPNQAWLDGDLLISPLIVRSRQPGDRFSPLGFGSHSMKLSDFMVNVKLPTAGRSNWPLVCALINGKDEILWVSGFRQSHHCRVTAKTRRIVWMALEKDE